jgi:hypothetical protein
MDGPGVSSEESEGEASEGDEDFDAEEDEETPKTKKKGKAGAQKGKQSEAAAAGAGKVSRVVAAMLLKQCAIAGTGQTYFMGLSSRRCCPNLPVYSSSPYAALQVETQDAKSCRSVQLHLCSCNDQLDC